MYRDFRFLISPKDTKIASERSMWAPKVVIKFLRARFFHWYFSREKFQIVRQGKLMRHDSLWCIKNQKLIGWNVPILIFELELFSCENNFIIVYFSVSRTQRVLFFSRTWPALSWNSFGTEPSRFGRPISSYFNHPFSTGLSRYKWGKSKSPKGAIYFLVPPPKAELWRLWQFLVKGCSTKIEDWFIGIHKWLFY